MGDASAKGLNCESFPFVDDGVSETGYELLSLTSTFVQRYTPPSYPFQYASLCVSFFAISEINQFALQVVAFAAAGPNGYAQSCAPHASDYNSQDWSISLREVLRLNQFFNSGGYFPCPEGEDGFCPGTTI